MFRAKGIKSGQVYRRNTTPTPPTEGFLLGTHEGDPAKVQRIETVDVNNKPVKTGRGNVRFSLLPIDGLPGISDLIASQETFLRYFTRGKGKE